MKEKIKIRNVLDLRVEKQKLKYEVKIYEQTMSSQFRLFNATLRTSAKRSLIRLSQKLMILSAIKLIRR